MSRPPRILSQTGMYHVLFRGFNRQDLFEEEADYEKLLEILGDAKQKHGMEVYAYCLMTNHVHLFLKEKEAGDIKAIMHYVLLRYAMWYNRKYQRHGSLLANRYQSEPVEDEEYYLTLVRYIHQNPLKAKIAGKTEEYPWSSYGAYLERENELVDTEFALSMMPRGEFVQFHKDMEEEDFSVSGSRRPSDRVLKKNVLKLTDGIRPEDIMFMSKADRNSTLALLREEGFTIGQLERITGINRGIISRANVQKKNRPQSAQKENVQKENRPQIAQYLL